MAGLPFKVSQLRLVGWSKWDPIGLADKQGVPPKGAEDEYDGYLIRIAGYLINGKGDAAAVDYLIESATITMGLGPSNCAGVNAAKQTVAEIKKYLISIGYEIA